MVGLPAAYCAVVLPLVGERRCVGWYDTSLARAVKKKMLMLSQEWHLKGCLELADRIFLADEAVFQVCDKMVDCAACMDCFWSGTVS